MRGQDQNTLGRRSTERHERLVLNLKPPFHLGS